jgi:hypothetical protein
MAPAYQVRGTEDGAELLDPRGEPLGRILGVSFVPSRDGRTENDFAFRVLNDVGHCTIQVRTIEGFHALPPRLVA